ncbi:DUF6973 domain-containing protein [Nocardia asteroides]|uniref:DUF6973 domain-containing protein n=1 Tax=Nocardia asteroides TaxID=1824 RepID=UPI001E2EC750|nr:hypothetical protein [Nocardia asteroides]UGT59789.1 hypothetical protein LTT61_21495 [Nocardia asteroides]
MSGGSYTTPLTVSTVLSWNPAATIAVAKNFQEAGTTIDTHSEAIARVAEATHEYFVGAAGDAVRERAAADRVIARRSADVFTDIQQEIYTQLDAMSNYVALLRETKAEAESSGFDLFVRDDGAVDSRMSNAEVLLKFGPTGLAEKEGYEYFLTSQIRTALTAIQQVDLEGAEKIKRHLENLAPEVKYGATPMPSDPVLADILRKYQTAASAEPAELWPSGIVLDRIRAISPDFQPILMTPGEIDLLTARMGTSGPLAVRDISDFFDIKAQAETAANATYPDSTALSDGHGDAFRHMYWNALMTQRYGEDWNDRYGTAHEQLGASPPTREAMDLHNNSIGREVALAKPDASPAELQNLISDRIRAGDAIVLDQQGQIEWSNRVGVGENGHPVNVEIPLPGGA